MDELKKALHEELVGHFGVTGPLGDDTELFTSGLVDSLGVMDLVGFVERRTGRPVPAADVTLENFGSIGRIAAYASRTASRSGRA